MSTKTAKRPELRLTTREPALCECQHPRPWGQVACVREAAVRAIVSCCDDCTEPAKHYVLCEPCAAGWQAQAELDGAGGRVVLALL